MAEYGRHVRIEIDSREYAYRTRAILGNVTGVLERFPRKFEEKPLLRIHELRFPRAHAEKRGVKLVDVAKHPANRYVLRVSTHLLFDAEIEIVAESADGLAVVAQILPELRDARRAWITSRHADDRDRIGETRCPARRFSGRVQVGHRFRRVGNCA